MKYLNPEQDDWDEHIDAILFSYRTSIHASTKFTPFYLMYGREAVLPVELQMTDKTVEKLHVDSDTVQSYVAHVEKMKQELFPVVDLNIKKAQKKQKAYYDKRHTSEKYQLGDLVLVKNMRNLSRKGGKTDVRWTGPYSIIVIHEKGLYSLQNCKGKTLAKKINGSRLKLYHERKGNCSNVSSQQVLDYRDEVEDIQILTEKCTTLPDDMRKEHRIKKLSAVINQCALKENSKEVTGYKQDEDDFTIHSKDSLLTTKANSSLDDQLYSSHLLRLWRTGAAMLAYCADEDEFDVS